MIIFVVIHVIHAIHEIKAPQEQNFEIDTISIQFYKFGKKRMAKRQGYSGILGSPENSGDRASYVWCLLYCYNTWK